MKRAPAFSALAIIVLPAAPSFVMAVSPIPVWEFNFNDTASGVEARNTGSDPNAANAYLTMENVWATPTNHRVAAGPSGMAYDQSFSSVPSSGGPGQYAYVPGAQIGGIANYNQITLCGWYNLSQPVPTVPNTYLRTFLIGNRCYWSEGMVVDFNAQAGSTNQLGLEINDYYSPHYGGDYYWPVPDDTGVWRFWAITYDGTIDGGTLDSVGGNFTPVGTQGPNVHLYMGTTTSSVAEVSSTGNLEMKHDSVTNPNGTIYNMDTADGYGGGDFVLSADKDNNYGNGMIGLQDDIRIFNGIVSSAYLEAIRLADLGPSWFPMIGSSWNNSANWTTKSVISGQHALADFTGLGTGTITLDGVQTVGHINIDSAVAYTFAAGAGGRLNIDDTGDPGGASPQINVLLGSHTITAPVSLANGVTINFTGGSQLSLNGTVSGSGTITANGAGRLAVGATGVLPSAGKLSIANGATVALAGALGSQTIAGLSIDSASKLDVGKQMVNVTYAGASPYSAILGWIRTGYVNNNAAGKGIVSSAAGGSSGVGIIDTGSLVEFGYTRLGDANMNGSVGFDDLTILAQHYDTGGTNWATGDFNYDGSTGFADLVDLAQNYGTQASSAQDGQLDAISPDFAAEWAMAQSEAAGVPEPASLGLLGIGAAALLGRRRRQHSL